jgi:hypothetical protein
VARIQGVWLLVLVWPGIVRREHVGVAWRRVHVGLELARVLEVRRVVVVEELDAVAEVEDAAVEGVDVAVVGADSMSVMAIN